MELIAFLISGIVVGIIATWIFWKYKFSELKKTLTEEQQQHSSSKQQIHTLQDTVASLTHQTHNFEKEIAVLEAKSDGLHKNNADLTQTIQQLQTDLNKSREHLNDAIEAKTKSETTLSNTIDSVNALHISQDQLKQERTSLYHQLSGVKEDNSSLQAQYSETVKRLEEQQIFITQANEKLKDAFNSLSAQALKNNNESFVTLAKSTLEKQVTEAKGEFEKKQSAIDAIVKPLSDSLGRFDTKIQDLEKIRMEQHGQINQYMQGVQQTTEKLQKETNNLVSALKTSHGRGRYGEIALRRVVEVAGMTNHCDFFEQQSVATDEGLLRPDMTIRLPERKTIVVDSKVPLNAYMAAFETESDEEKKVLFERHAAAVRDHLKKLSQKAYWNQFPESPDYVVMYMQIESSFGTALQTDPTLIEDAIRNNIIFATPTTLITLLRTVGFVWQQVNVAENIEQIRDAGMELFDRTTVLIKHFAQMGGSIKTAVSHYNNAVASLESRFVPQAKRLYALGSAYTKNTVPEINQIELNVRELAVISGDLDSTLLVENKSETEGQEAT